MAEKEEKKTEKPAQGRITEKQRFSYIGFEVFPGKPKDLFKSEADRQKHLEAVKARQDKGETVRDNNTLLEERISMGEKLILTIACVVMIAALFLPWYSAYTETVEEAAVEEVTPATAPDSLVVGAAEGDTTAILSGETLVEESEALAAEGQATGDQAGTGEALATETPEDDGPEIIHSGFQREKFTREYYSATYFGAFGLLGSAGGILFGSGMVAVATILMLVLMIALLIAPLYTLYLLYGSKLRGDELALRLKKGLRLNWAPLVVFFVVMVLSFVGGSYAETVPYNSLGDSYSIATFLGVLSYGVFVSLAMSVLLAVKGIEI